jgi:hypothetical protein
LSLWAYDIASDCPPWIERGAEYNEDNPLQRLKIADFSMDFWALATGTQTRQRDELKDHAIGTV